jgi:hypothetical protein
MKNLKDVMEYLVRQNASSAIMAAVEAAQQALAVGGKQTVPASVWCDFGDGEFQKFDFETEAGRNAFADGILTAANAWGIDDFRLCFTPEQIKQARADDA